MNVLSLFDGISGARIALDNLGVKCYYFAAEIDKYAVSISKYNYPDIKHLGDVKKINLQSLPKIDLLIGGSPCQSFSKAKRQKESGLVKGKSVLFYEYLRILKEVKPRWFLFENVAGMKKKDKYKISKHLQTFPIEIDSSRLTAQSRKRYYWTNIKGVEQPEDKNILLKDIIESGYTEKLKSYCITSSYEKAYPKGYLLFNERQLIFKKPVKVGQIGNGGQGQRIYNIEGKSVTINASRGDQGASTGLYFIKNHLRKLTPIECERLQGMPDNYTKYCIENPNQLFFPGLEAKIILSNSQRYKLIGNGFTIPVIEHIISHI
ncbi:MAG: DNA (cytosine-5-)-methyltransferase [bacterium]|nr:DNA (cytosine-5-)-methyltransferase [bacterium]